MIPQKISRRVVADRLAWIDRMIAELRLFPLASKDAFFADRRNVWSAESCLRRTLEALFDLGRHLLAKGFSVGVSEYKEIASSLREHGVLNAEDAAGMQMLAGYRNRLTHFYREVSEEELYEICSTQLGDVEHLANRIRDWLAQNAHMLDDSL